MVFNSPFFYNVWYSIFFRKPLRRNRTVEGITGPVGNETSVECESESEGTEYRYSLTFTHSLFYFMYM
jgi:hypothetical protein